MAKFTCFFRTFANKNQNTHRGKQEKDDERADYQDRLLGIPN